MPSIQTGNCFNATGAAEGWHSLHNFARAVFLDKYQWVGKRAMEQGWFSNLPQIHTDGLCPLPRPAFWEVPCHT
jgi:hypothetical protein